MFENTKLYNFGNAICESISLLLCLQASEKELIWTIRISTVVIGAFTMLLAIYVRSIYTLWALCSDLVYVILFPQLTCVIYFSSTNMYGSVAAYIVDGRGTSSRNSVYHSVSLAQNVENGIAVQHFPYKTCKMLMSLLTLLIVSYFTNLCKSNQGYSGNQKNVIQEQRPDMENRHTQQGT